MAYDHIAQTDPEVFSALAQELGRQRGTIELIASENIVSPAVMEAMGSVLTNKYAEGYPGKRYYGGCEKVDIVENLARERACELFSCSFANVQPHSGANANLAAYMALIEPGDTVIGMSLDQGGHLTHGSPANFSGRLYRFLSYGLDPATETIDYEGLERLARAERPKLIVGGASAIRALSILSGWPRLLTAWAPSSWSIWRISQALLPPARIQAPSPMRTW